MKRTICAITSLFIIGIAGPLLGATITVDTEAPGISADNWCSLIEAIENANADAAVHVDCPTGSGGDLIVLGDQLTYTIEEVHNDTLGPNALPVISSDITIDGWNSIVERDDTAPELRLFFIDVAGNLTLNDLTVRNGDVGAEEGGAVLNLGSVILNQSEIRNSSANKCGGLLNRAGDVWAYDSGFIGNHAQVDGGGFCNWAFGGQAYMSLVSSRIEGNTAGDDGGGGECRTSDGQSVILEVTDCTVSNNLAAGLDGVGGGLLQSNSGGPTAASATMTVIDSEIIHNQANGAGAGGIACHGVLDSGFAPELVIRRSLISDNQSVAGGGIFGNENARITIEDSTISDNRAVGYLVGGIALLTGSELQLIRSTVSGNTSFAPSPGGWGGGLGVVDATATIFNSTISKNEVSGPGAQGGGIGLFSSADWGELGASVEIENSTITDNEAQSLGGGIAAHLDSGTGEVEVVLRNSIVADNHEQSGMALGNCILTAPAFLNSLGFNLADDLTCDLFHSDDMVVADAMLGPLGDNGGPTATHMPLHGSPGIDSGDDADCPATDQRGIPRPWDGDDDGVSRCDRGAVEVGFSDGFESGDTSGWSGTVP